MDNKNENKKGIKNIVKKIIELYKNRILNKIGYAVVTIMFIIYIYRVHDYLGEFKLNFQWGMIIFFIVWIIFPYVSEIELFGNKIKMRELQEKIDTANEKISSMEQKDELQEELNEKIYIENKRQQSSKESNIEDFNSKIFGYQVILELRLMNIYKKLRKVGKINSKEKITFTEIVHILYKEKYITQNIFDDIYRFQIIFSKDNIKEEDYKYIKERYDRIVEILDIVYKELIVEEQK